MKAQRRHIARVAVKTRHLAERARVSARTPTTTTTKFDDGGGSDDDDDNNDTLDERRRREIETAGGDRPDSDCLC